jgi:hypothetical protein
MWLDYGLYWARIQAYSRISGELVKAGSPPTTKVLEYQTLYAGTPIEMELCVGVWDGSNFTPLNQDELKLRLNDD